MLLIPSEVLVVSAYLTGPDAARVQPPERDLLGAVRGSRCTVVPQLLIASMVRGVSCFNGPPEARMRGWGGTRHTPGGLAH